MDEELFIQGDEGAFERLVEKHSAKLQASLIKFSKILPLEDLMQEIWLRVWKVREKYVHKDNFEAWAYRIGVNAAIEAYRKTHNQVDGKRRVRLVYVPSYENFDLIDPHVPDVIGVVWIKDHIPKITRQKHGEAISMALEGLNNEEIAARKNISADSAEQYVNAGCRHLRAMAAQQGLNQ